MKKLSVLLAIIMLLGLGITNVQAGNYFSANVGIGWIDDIDVTDGIDKAELSFDPGYGVTAALGHAYATGVRAELEFEYFKSDLDTVTLVGFGQADVGGDGTVKAAMVNCYYDFLGQAFTPFVGAGIGYANAEIDVMGVSEDDDVFAYQAMAGVSFDLAENIKTDIQYRFFGTEDLEFDDAVDVDAVNSHNLMVGLRFSF